MNTPDAKMEMIRNLVNSKVRWGTDDQEVLDWLWEKYRIGDDEALELLAAGHREKSKAVRFKAVLMLIFSGVGVLIGGWFLFLEWSAGVIVIGRGSGAILGLGVVSLGLFLRSLWRLLTGKSAGSVD
jgi:hypothetical protein